ncbi:MAG: 16S rRNA (guanine(527)-N(7))-methyltransferase RsmG [Bacilli bacterium]|nr:16S rRNA (guanine(527)-N(7))-methyltransferase RsmG [Bacilli bacterium]
MDYQTLVKAFPLDTQLVDQFLTYLLKVNQVMNLTSITKKDEAIEKHVYDSLLISKAYDFSHQLVLDVGSGGGFPGIPLAILYPTAHFVLLDATKKKVNYLNDVIKLLKLTNVEAKCARIEELTNREHYDVVIARALSELRIYLELAAPFTKVNGHIIALKGAKANAELAASKEAIKKLDLTLEHIQNTSLVNGEERINFIFRKLKKTNARYPRSFGEIKHHPL